MIRFLLLLPLLAAALAAGEATPAGPSAEEAVVWMRLNRHRADPRVCSFDVASQVHLGNIARGERLSPDFYPSDWAKGLSKAKPQPLVCFEPRLNAAARELLKGTPVKYKPVDPAPALRTAGYEPAEGWALLARDAPSLEVAYARALARIYEVTDIKGRKTYRHDGSKLVLPEWREVGIAVAAGKGSCSVAIVLGKGAGKRYLGGVVYADGNHDGILDVGEGKAGVTVKVGAATATTGPGGAWSLTTADDVPVEVAFAGAGATATRQVAKGSAQVDWRLPDADDVKAADRLLAAVAAESGKPAERARKATVALLLGTRMAILDDERQKKIDAAVGDLRSQYESALAKIFAQLREEPAVYKATVADTVKSWEGALPAAWKGRMEALQALGKKVEAAQIAPEATREKAVAAVLDQLAKEAAKADEPLVLKQLATWREALVMSGGDE